jgi:hypothetical protein
MNSVLRPQGLSVYINSSNDVFVRPIKGEFVSTAVNPSEKRVISFCPEVFRVPDCEVNKNLVAVMMPFSEEFREVYNTIGLACSSVGMDCIRADDRGAWDNSEIIQDVFKLIFSSSIVVTDFSGKNENVYYEAGIAHTLGKLVIPIAQSKNDLPFDLEHHRAIIYYNNHEGRNELEIDLESRLQKLKERLQNKRSVMS